MDWCREASYSLSSRGCISASQVHYTCHLSTCTLLFSCLEDTSFSPQLLGAERQRKMTAGFLPVFQFVYNILHILSQLSGLSPGSAYHALLSQADLLFASPKFPLYGSLRFPCYSG